MAWRLAIIWTNDRILFKPTEQTSVNFNRSSYIFVQKNVFENSLENDGHLASAPVCIELLRYLVRNTSGNYVKVGGGVVGFISIQKCRITIIRITIIKIRRSHDRLILIMEMLIHEKTFFTLRQGPGPRLNIKTVFPRYGIPMLKIRRSRDRLIFNMGIPILVRRHLYIKTVPWFLALFFCNQQLWFWLCRINRSLSVTKWWRHQMETHSALLTFCAGISPVTGEFPHKGLWRGALIFSLICA